MNYLFDDLEKTFSLFASFDEKTIKKANEIKKDLYLTFRYYHDLDYKKIEFESKKRLLCFELFNEIPYYFNLLETNFLMWYSFNYEEIKESILYWQSIYESFLNCFNREPNSFYDLKRWDNLSIELKIKYQLENMIKLIK